MDSLFPEVFAPGPSFDATFSQVRRLQLDDRAWIDVAPGWVEGHAALFEEVLATRSWGQRTRFMYERKVLEPRLTDHWRAEDGERLEPAIIDQMRLALGRRYGVTFDSVGFNFYRGGQDSVAWHGDRIVKAIEEPIVVLVSLGEPRNLLMRPKGGGRSHRFALGGGDLFVTGGLTQRTWEHSVPKVAHAGRRISLAFRHGLDPRAYGKTATL